MRVWGMRMPPRERIVSSLRKRDSPENCCFALKSEVSHKKEHFLLHYALDGAKTIRHYSKVLHILTGEKNHARCFFSRLCRTVIISLQ